MTFGREDTLVPETGTPPAYAPRGLPAAVSVLAGDREGPAAGYVVLATATGTGYSALADTVLTGWEEPGAAGLRFFVRDLESGAFWSPGRPARVGAARIQAHWQPGSFTLEHIENGVRTTMQMCVLADRPAELRRIMLTDLSGAPRRLDVTSLAEVVLNYADAHSAHPAFSKLFLQTVYVDAQQALLVRRRSRDPRERHPALVHAALEEGEVQFETDRARFYGRGRHAERPAALLSQASLSGTTGNVLDPVVSLRRTLSIPAGHSASVTFLLGAAADDQTARAMTASWGQPTAIEHAFASARAAAEDQMARLGISAHDHVYAQHLAAAVLRGDPGLRAGPAILARAVGQPANLVRLGIEPRRPLALVHADAEATERMRRLHRTWQALNLPIQLVVLADDETFAGHEPGLIHLRPGDLTAAEQDLLAATAALVITESLPDLAILKPPAASTPRPDSTAPIAAAAPDVAGLSFYNGWGGFSPDGSEYVIHVRSDAAGALRLPPRPWTNLLANDKLGCIISETGAGATWCGNSREHRLTPWSNDPLLDPHGDAIYLRDEAAGIHFSCLPGPAPAGGDYEMRHGHGYTRCRRTGNELAVETLIFVDRREPVRISRVRVTNQGRHPRRLSLFTYSELVLGDLPRYCSRFVITSHDAATGALLAQNPTAGPFAAATAFGAVVGDAHLNAVQHSADRATFLGPGGDPAAPAALSSGQLDGRVGPGLDPCFALQATLALDPGDTAEAWVMLGQAADVNRARELAATLSRPGACAAAWRATRDFWREFLDGLQVQTPSRALNLMVNGWLGYQTLACRLWGRSALYQSGGAFGFRDQLQDALALLPLWPELARRQILLHAAHQFVEGDVLHWWHPPTGRGIRTRFADDLLWLPFATVEYLNVTGDRGILAEPAPFLAAQTLEPGQDEVHLLPETAGETADLYDHCCRALDRALTRGVHGLPLFGTGDWNDGMNRVGREGRGESVWMGFFLVTIIDGFLPLCQVRGDSDRADRYRSYRDEMIQTLNNAGWDGGWYLRGYYDDGSPLGSWENKECAIDALVQAWSVLSGAAPPARAEQVMDAVEEHLISADERLIRLLTPPFVNDPHDPGYIKGYVAGVRENGGQYTHAALWVVRAMAALGRRHRASALLELVNPVGHATTPQQVARYQVEPYVVAADVYGSPPHVGRGGWTWYTGSSGWMLRVALESILGLRAEGETLVVAPCVPDDWPEYSVTWRVPPLGAGHSDGTASTDVATRYEIHVVNRDHCSETVVAVTCDDDSYRPVDGAARVPLLRDGRTHRLLIALGPWPEVRP
jgi:cellobiose phosphorylase